MEKSEILETQRFEKTQKFESDILIIDHGLSGLVTAFELTKKGFKVAVIDQESRQNT